MYVFKDDHFMRTFGLKLVGGEHIGGVHTG